MGIQFLYDRLEGGGRIMIASMLTLTKDDAVSLRLTDPYSVHRIVYDLFEDVRSSGEKFSSISSGILYVDKGSDNHCRTLLMLSNRPPKVPCFGKLTSHEIPETFLKNGHYRFEIVINPTRRDSKTGKTISIKGRHEIKNWFKCKASQSWGFMVDEKNLEVVESGVMCFSKGSHQVTIAKARIVGCLLVTDLNKFIRSFNQGVGRGRAFGFGLLQIIPLSNS